jgi:hypothetical protein
MWWQGCCAFDSAANILRDRTIHCFDMIGENSWWTLAAFAK